MPTTSNFGWTTPADTDLVKDGAAAIRTLGNGIDTSLVDLKGGTTGQVLSKASNTDLDFTWTAGGDITEVQAGTGISVASGTGPIPVVTNTVATTFDAKGDLVAGTGADTFAKLTVGANDTVLTADSTTGTGLKWATPAISIPIYPIKPDRYYRTPGVLASLGPNEDETYYAPILLPACTVDRIGFKTRSTFSGTVEYRLGIYAANTSTNKPDTLILDAGLATATAASTEYEITISQALSGGLYWLAINPQVLSGGANTAIEAVTDAPQYSAIGVGSGSICSTSETAGAVQTGVTGAFANAGTVSLVSYAPGVSVRVN
jgi:hypothetical protein